MLEDSFFCCMPTKILYCCICFHMIYDKTENEGKAPSMSELIYDFVTVWFQALGYISPLVARILISIVTTSILYPLCSYMLSWHEWLCIALIKCNILFHVFFFNSIETRYIFMYTWDLYLMKTRRQATEVEM